MEMTLFLGENYEKHVLVVVIIIFNVGRNAGDRNPGDGNPRHPDGMRFLRHAGKQPR